MARGDCPSAYRVKMRRTTSACTGSRVSSGSLFRRLHPLPPPPNQRVYVRLKEPFKLESMWEPVWVTGTMETKSFTSDLAAAGYTLQATKIEEYEY